VLLLLGWAPPARARSEDALRRLQRAAVAHAGLSEGATTRMLVREHLAALLPQVRVTLGRGWQLTATGSVVDGLTAPTSVDNDHVSYAVSAGWDLSRLLAPRAAAQAHHDEPLRARARLEVQAQVTSLLACRCRLLQLDSPSASQQAELGELEAALDLLTGGHPLPEVTSKTICPSLPRFFGPTLPLHAPLVRPTAGAGAEPDESAPMRLP
jgi:hypothetical protein